MEEKHRLKLFKMKDVQINFTTDSFYTMKLRSDRTLCQR